MLKVACLAGLAWVLSAAVLLVTESAEQAQERENASYFSNHSKQIGLALHNYFDTPGMPRLSALWGRRHSLLDDHAGEKVAERAGADVRGEVVAKPPRPQRVIHTAEVSLVVEDLVAAESELRKLVEGFRGHVAHSQVNQYQGAQRTGKWTVQIPVDAFSEFVDSAVALGIPLDRRTNAQDVTEEHVDLQTRIANKQELEKRILGLLQSRTGDIEDVIAVEKQLARVREEIDSHAGRLKYLEQMTAMSTVTISAREDRDYISPQAPSFSSRIGRAWAGSADVLQRFGQALVLVAVAVGPWLPIVAVLALVVVWASRRRRARMQEVEK